MWIPYQNLLNTIEIQNNLTWSYLKFFLCAIISIWNFCNVESGTSWQYFAYIFNMYHWISVIVEQFLNQVHAGCRPAHLVFLKSFRPRTLVYVCVDKAVLWPLQILLSINWMGVALVTLPIMNACQRRLKTGTSYSRTTKWHQLVEAYQL